MKGIMRTCSQLSHTEEKKETRVDSIRWNCDDVMGKKGKKEGGLFNSRRPRFFSRGWIRKEKKQSG